MSSAGESDSASRRGGRPPHRAPHLLPGGPLHEAVPGGAVRAAAQPLGRLVAALLAGEDRTRGLAGGGHGLAAIMPDRPRCANAAAAPCFLGAPALGPV